MLLGEGRVIGFTATVIGFLRFVAGEKRWGKILTHPNSSEKKLNEFFLLLPLGVGTKQI